MRIVLGVAAGIAAYKACELLRLLTEAGHRVRVVPTPAALDFVGAATWAALSGQPVLTSPQESVHEVPHVRLGQEADLVIVAPATADLMARAAAGRSDDLLTATLLTARCPVIFAPAMHTEMWEHAATRANVATLRSRGCLVLDPASGRLTGPDSGPGRLPEPAELFSVVRRVLARGSAAMVPDLAGRTILVSAGGTREDLDPVRYLGNWSSGKQGYALARTAASRGATVTLVAANAELPDPAGARVIRVTSASQLRDAMLAEAGSADVIVMAAAVADFRPATRSPAKIKKSGGAPAPIELAENPDIVRDLVAARRRPGQLIVAFAAETGDVLANGRAKLAGKGCDLLVVNQVGNGLAFGTEDNEATVLGADGSQIKLPRAPKDEISDAIWDEVAARFGQPRFSRAPTRAMNRAPVQFGEDPG